MSSNSRSDDVAGNIVDDNYGPDSKKPATTCKAITQLGRRCKFLLSHNMLNLSGEPIPEGYCWTHRYQAAARAGSSP